MGNRINKENNNTNYQNILYAPGAGDVNERGQDYRADREHRSDDNCITGVINEVQEKYAIEPKVLGRGHYGVVRKCINKVTGDFYAVKTIRKSNVRRKDILRREIDILKTLNHPNIVRLIDVYESEKSLHLVTELCTGGQLFERIIAKTRSSERHYSEQDAAVVVKSLLSAIEYCHELNISHRDLKPENLLFQNMSDNSTLKIIDFGLSRFDDDEVNHMRTMVGTPYYVAPEVFESNYGMKCDIWSIGVITYILLCGYPPFYGNSNPKLYSAIMNDQLVFPSPEWDPISTEAKDLISALLQKNPEVRPTARDALEFSWFTKVSTLPTVPVTPSMQNSLKSFIGMNILKKVALNIIAETLAEKQIEHLKTAFGRIDVNRDGHVTLEELQKAMEAEGNNEMQSDLRAIMDGIDLDHNNQLDYKEFLAATMDINVAIREENIKSAFDVFDFDKSGTITIEELKAFMGSTAIANEVLDELDINKDGVVSYDEFRAMMMGVSKDSTLYRELMKAEAIKPESWLSRFVRRFI